MITTEKVELFNQYLRGKSRTGMQSLLSRDNHFNIYVFILMFTAGNIPLSPYMISVCMFLLALNWIAEGNFKSKFNILLNNKPLLVFILLYFCHIVWLFNTSDFSWGIHDVQIKLPLLVFPLLIISSPKLSLNHIKYIILTFVLGVAINTIISLFVFLFFDKAYYNIREISLFISHIRFSLMIVMSIGSLVYLIFSPIINKTKIEKAIYYFTLLWLTFFLFLLQSFTGIFILLILLFPILFWIKSQVQKKFLNRIINYFTIAFFVILIANLVYPSYLYFRKMDKEGIKPAIKTINGNRYNHNLRNTERENGYNLWLYICKPELIREWNKRSEINYFSRDKKGQPLKITLIRYLTSKGYHKDSVGISLLSNSDIQLIENGVANHIYGKKMGIYPRIYELIWEIDKYKRGLNPSGHSFTQRFEYFKNGFGIIGDNFWFGVGTGDVPSSFNEQYNKSQSALKKKVRLRTHNQYITFFISFGLIGFLIVTIAFFYPIFIQRKKLYFLPYFFMAVLFLSMLNEDTLETHVGVSLFSFCYSLLILSNLKDQKNISFAVIKENIISRFRK